VSFLKEAQIKQLITKVLQGFLGEEEKEKKCQLKFREIMELFANCLKDVIEKVQESFAQIICETLIPEIIKNLKPIDPKKASKTKTPEDLIKIRENLFDILNAIFKKFNVFLYGKLNSQSPLFEKQGLINLFLNEIDSERKEIQYKSINCLGILSSLLLKEDVCNIVAILIKNKIAILKPLEAKTAQEKKKSQTLLMNAWKTLQSIIRFSSNKMGQFFDDILRLIETDISLRESKSDSITDMDFNTDLYDLYMSGLEYMVAGCPKECEKSLKKIIEIIKSLLDWDPNKSAKYEGTDSIEIEQDEYAEGTRIFSLS